MTKRVFNALILFLAILSMGVSSARATWVADGVAVCSANGPQYASYIASDGSGGAIIAWLDQRSGTRVDIYAQRIDANGEILWAANGVPVCTASVYCVHDVFRIVSDGSGGAIIAWRDDRNGPACEFRIYAQRINAAGSAVWTTDGIPMCTTNAFQDSPSLIPDGSGGAIAAWEDYRNGNYDIYAQKISPTGSRLWTSSGAAVCTESKAQYSPWLASDGSGGAIVGWQDHRSDSSFDLYAQRIGSNGTAMWTSNGIAVCAANGDQQPCLLVPDGSGGAVFLWRTMGYAVSNWDLSVQKVDANGLVQWAADGVTVCPGGSDMDCFISDGSGGAIVAWRDSRGGPTYDVYAQRVLADGSVMWTAGGVPVCTAANDQFPSSLTPDGSGGAIVTMRDKRSGEWDVYAQRFDANGQVLWTADGIPVCTIEGQQSFGFSVPDGSGGAIIAWGDPRSGVDQDIYAQRVDAAGHTVVATLLQGYAVAFSETGIALTWTLSEVDEGTEFFIERAAAPSGPFIERPSGALRRDGLSFSYIDGDWEPGTSYWFRVGYSAGGVRTILFESGPVSTPAMPLTLLQNHPNPFNPSTQIRYYLPENCHVVLDVYDINGALITRLAEGNQDKGYHSVSWAGRDRNGREMSSGVYFYRMRAGKTEISRKMVLAR